MEEQTIINKIMKVGKRDPN